MDRSTKREVWEALIVVPAALAVAVFSLAALPLKLALVSCLLGWAMLAIAVVDARRFIIPDVLSLPAIPIGLVASGRLLEPSADGLVRAVYFRIRRREGLGLGDVKLAAVAGAWIGWQSLSDVVLLAAALALSLVLALGLMRGEALSAAARIPFGCFLAPSIWLVWALAALDGIRLF